MALTQADSLPHLVRAPPVQLHHSYLLRSTHQVTQHPSLLTLISVLKLYKMPPKLQQGPGRVYQRSPIEVQSSGDAPFPFSALTASAVPTPHPILTVKCPLPFPPPLLVYLWEKLKLSPYLLVLRISGEVQEQPFASFPGLVEQTKHCFYSFCYIAGAKAFRSFSWSDSKLYDVPGFLQLFSI